MHRLSSHIATMRASSTAIGHVALSVSGCVAATAVRNFSTLMVRSTVNARSHTRIGATLTPVHGTHGMAGAASTLPISSSSISALQTISIRHTQSATHFRFKKQKEWKLRQSKAFADLKTHAGCKKRFRFISRWAIVCKHHAKHHKNYKKRATRLRRLRPMKVVPRNLVKRLKIMMPYWRNQLGREEQYMRIHKEPSVKQPSSVSYERQKQFIEAQNQRLQTLLLNPKPYFPRPVANASSV